MIDRTEMFCLVGLIEPNLVRVTTVDSMGSVLYIVLNLSSYFDMLRQIKDDHAV